MNYNWNWGIFFQMEPGASGTYLEYLIGGLGWTLVTAGFAWIIALFLGVIIGVLRTTGHKGIERGHFLKKLLQLRVSHRRRRKAL